MVKINLLGCYVSQENSATIFWRGDILNLRSIVTGNTPKTYEIKLARWFKDRNSNELLYIANYKALDCLLGNRCFCVLRV